MDLQKLLLCGANRGMASAPSLQSAEGCEAWWGELFVKTWLDFESVLWRFWAKKRSDVKSAFSCAPNPAPAVRSTRPICSDEFTGIDGRSFFGCSGMGNRREMAEGEGFEPPLPVRVKRFSRPPVSTTHTSLREWRCSLMIATRLAKAKERPRCSQP
jgi:hypothetical protein